MTMSEQRENDSTNMRRRSFKYCTSYSVDAGLATSSHVTLDRIKWVQTMNRFLQEKRVTVATHDPSPCDIRKTHKVKTLLQLSHLLYAT